MDHLLAVVVPQDRQDGVGLGALNPGDVRRVIVGDAAGDGDDVLERAAQLEDGRLCDLAPTLLTMMNQPQPEAMTGTPLLRFE